MIRQCFDLCPEYSTDANEQARVAAGICVAVPTPSSLPVPSGSAAPRPVSITSIVPLGTGSSVAPSSGPSVSPSFGLCLVPAVYLQYFAFVFTVILTQL